MLSSQLNFLLITADDLNYNSLGVTGSPVAGVSPNLDQLAREGIMFTQSHVNIAVCQPSRSVLMTGRYPHRNGAAGEGELPERHYRERETSDAEGEILLGGIHSDGE